MSITRSLRSLLFASLTLTAASALVACTTDGDTGGVSDTSDAVAAAGSFDFWQADNAQWYFHVAASNGETLLTSEGYDDRTSAINGALSVLNNGTESAAYRLVGSTHGYLVELRAANNEIIATSEVYASKSNATRAVTTFAKAIGGYLAKQDQNVTGARVELATDAAGATHFDVYAKNGQVVLSSQSYASEASAYNGAFAAQEAAAAKGSFVLAQSASGSWYFDLRAANNETVGTSQQYTTKASAQAGETAVSTALSAIEIF